MLETSLLELCANWSAQSAENVGLHSTRTSCTIAPSEEFSMKIACGICAGHIGLDPPPRRSSSASKGVLRVLVICSLSLANGKIQHNPPTKQGANETHEELQHKRFWAS